MKSEDQAACDAAWHIERTKAAIVPSDGFGFEKGFAAGCAHARAESEWRKIETVEDLPKEKGRYLWRRGGGRCGVYNFNPSELIFISGMVATYSHWMPIPPYTPEGTEAQNEK